MDFISVPFSPTVKRKSLVMLFVFITFNKEVKGSKWIYFRTLLVCSHECLFQWQKVYNLIIITITNMFGFCEELHLTVHCQQIETFGKEVPQLMLEFYYFFFFIVTWGLKTFCSTLWINLSAGKRYQVVFTFNQRDTWFLKRRDWWEMVLFVKNVKITFLMYNVAIT